jgi:hypothetical protein
VPYFRAKQKELGIEKPSIKDLKEALGRWSHEVADIRLISGLGRTPQEIFDTEERKTLHPLPQARWEQISWRKCIVRRDWRIIVDCAYYSVPYHLIGKTVDVCISDSLLRIFYEHEEIAIHERPKEKWAYQRKAEHAPPFKEAVLQCSRDGLAELAQEIGPWTHKMATQILSHPSIDKLRPVRSLLSLEKKYSKERLECACKRAFTCRLFAYLNVKNILENGLDAEALEDDAKIEGLSTKPERYARNPADYKVLNTAEETYGEKIERLSPPSPFGHGMYGPYLAPILDQMTREWANEADDIEEARRTLKMEKVMS